MKKTRRFAAMVAAMALAATMVAPTMMNASAADVNIKVQTDGKAANEVTTITPDKDNVEHTYKAYQIFTGEYKLKPGKEEGSTNPEDYEFKVTGLGSDADATTNNLLSNAAFLAFKAADDKPTVGEAIGSATGAAAAIAAAQALDGIVDGSPKAQELADILAAAMTTGGTALSTTGADFAEGYYLVKDSYTKAEGGSNDAISDFILRVNSKKDSAGITIIPKKSYPEVIKKVQENAKNVLTDWAGETATTLEGEVSVTDKWNDVADYNIGDAVPFQLYGSMPQTLNDYTGYYYEFSDNLAKQFNQPQTVNVHVGEDKTLSFKWNSETSKYELESGYLSAREATNAVTGTVYTMKGDDTFKTQVNTAFSGVDGWDSKTESEKAQYLYEHWDAFCEAVDEGEAYAATDKDTYVTKEDNVVITPAVTARTEDKATDGNCRVTWTAGTGTNPGNLAVTFENIKAYEGVDADTIVTVDYTAVLNDTAVIGLDGQENTVKLIYSNNPNVKYTPDTENNDNEGATHKTGGNTDNTPEDKVVVFTYEIDINKIDGDTNKPLAGAKFKLSNGTKWATVDANGKLTGWADSEDGGTELESDANGLFKIIGLDSGTYTLKETAPPEGYNLPANPNFSVELTATTINTQKYTSAAYPDAAAVLTDIAGKINSENMTKLDRDESANRGANGGVKGTIENNKGTALPSTGGMGTKLFIAGGGITATLAAVYLVSKKRSRKEEE